MLKFTPTSHPSSSSIINKPQTSYTNFPIHNTNNKPFHTTTFPRVHISNKPLHISSCTKNNADLVFKETPVSKDVSNIAYSAFEPVLAAVKCMISFVVKLVSSQSSIEFNLEIDLIKFDHNGREIFGVVEQMVHHSNGLMETTLLCEHGLEKFNLRCSQIFYITYRSEEFGETMWMLSTKVKCKAGDDLRKMVEEIKDVLNAHEAVKSNKYSKVAVYSIYPEHQIAVMGFVTCSKLRTPRYNHYMEIRRKVLSDIDEIKSKHGSKEESALGD